MVADEDKRLFILAGVGLEAEGGVDLPIEDLHHQHEYRVQQAVGQFYLPRLQLFLQRLFHMFSPRLFDS